MKRLFKTLERLFIAITFAEAGDAETARRVLKEKEVLEIQISKPEEIKKEATFTAHPVKP